jgi:hypothetical protein
LVQTPKKTGRRQANFRFAAECGHRQAPASRPLRADAVEKDLRLARRINVFLTSALADVHEQLVARKSAAAMAASLAAQRSMKCNPCSIGDDTCAPVVPPTPSVSQDGRSINN